MDSTELNDPADTVEAVKTPKVRPQKTEAQLETIKKARSKKAENDEARQAERERLSAERRFERLLDLFDKVRIEPPVEVPKKEPEPVERPKPQAKLRVEPAKKEVFLRFM